MSDNRFKEALSNLSPEQRTCFLYLERQINEIKNRPLSAVSELEKLIHSHVKRNVDILSELVKAMEKVHELDEKMSSWDPDYMDKTKKDYLETIERLKRELINEIDAGRKLWDVRIERLEKLYHEFDKFFVDHPSARKKKIT